MTTLQENGHKVRLFGGWYKQDKVYRIDLNGNKTYLGFIQTVRKHKQTTYTTHKNNTAVIGIDMQWLLSDNQ